MKDKLKLVEIFRDDNYAYLYKERARNHCVLYYKADLTKNNKLYHIRQISAYDYTLAVKNYFENLKREESRVVSDSLEI